MTMQATTARLFLTLARHEMIVACQQDLLLSNSAESFSILDLLTSLSPLSESGDVSSSKCTSSVRGLLSMHCTHDEMLLAMRAFCTNKACLNYDSFSLRVTRRKSLWDNCHIKVATIISKFVEKTETYSQPKPLRRLNEDNKKLTTILNLFVHELTTERLSEAMRRNLAGHVRFNVPGLFAIIAAYDPETKKKSISLRALQLFCAEYGVVLENWHLRALSSRYADELVAGTSAAAIGMSYAEFETMVVEVKVDCYDQQTIICGVESVCIANREIQTTFATVKSKVVYRHLTGKYLGADRVWGKKEVFN